MDLRNDSFDMTRRGTHAIGFRAAITGASCRLPGANTVEEFWSLLRDVRHGLGPSPEGRYEALELTPEYIESLEAIGHHWGGFLDGVELFDPHVFGMSHAEASTADPQHRILMEVVWEALERACEAPDRLAGSNIGVFVGMSGFDYAMFQAAFDPYGELVTPFSVPGAAHSIAANRISYLLDLKGPSLAVDTACSSSSTALHMALRSMAEGECDGAIVCGAHVIMTPYLTKGFKRARMLSRDGLVKPFDAKTDGYVRAEGAVAMLIRPEDVALERRDPMVGVISGSALNHDGKTSGIAMPNRDRQVELIRSAQAAAGVNADEIDFVEAHGTGTYTGDETELKALGELFPGDRDRTPCYVGSVKANLGHLEPISGLAGLLKAALCLREGTIPAQVNLSEPMPAALAPDTRISVPMQTVSWPRPGDRRLAGVSCLGFGGANSHVIVEAARPAKPEIADNRPVEVLKLAARKPEQLAQMAGRLGAHLDTMEGWSLPDVCHSANVGRSDFAERVVIRAANREELRDALLAVSEGRPHDRVVNGRARSTLRVALLVAPGLEASSEFARDLYEADPRFAAAMTAFDEALRPHLGRSLVEGLVGGCADAVPPGDGDVTARLAGLAVSYAMTRLLAEIGIEWASVIDAGAGAPATELLSGRRPLVDVAALLLDEAARPSVETLESALATARDEGAHVALVMGHSEGSGTLTDAEEGGDFRVVAPFAGAANGSEAVTGAIAALYTAGAVIDWRGYDVPFHRNRLVLPTYPFARERFWFTDGAPDRKFRKPPGAEARPGAADVPTKPVDAGVSVSAPTAAVAASADGEGTAISRPEVLEFLRRAVASAATIDPSELTDTLRLSEIRIDSIHGLQLLMQIERELGLMPDPEVFSDELTFAEAVDKVHDLANTDAARRARSKRAGSTEALPGGADATGISGTAAALPQRGSSDRPDPLPGVMEGAADEATDIGRLIAAGSPEDYLDSIRPDLTGALHEMLLDVDFTYASGDRLSGERYGSPIDAVDMLGGFGSTLFGHNHPQLVAVLQRALIERRPVFAQLSNRTASGTLAKELARRVSEVTGSDYAAVLGSSGAEMVDAALKHALFEWVLRRDMPDDRSTAAASARPAVLAIEGSYHGKTLGAYALTWNAPGRAELNLEGPFDVVWLPREDGASAREIAKSMEIGGVSRIAAIFAEPIQGEGGIFPLSDSYAATLREIADQSGAPLIVDEIQTGLGRSGTFLASQQNGLRGDYYLFGKSLGGGLTKTGALLIDRARYCEGYGFAHTSTFAEDDHSALVGLRALEILDEERIADRCREMGDYLVERLSAIAAEYPDVLLDVRGRGLMVGIELASQSDSRSELIAGLSNQRLLGVAVASHLLHRHGVRVGTALSRPTTLRLEPSAFITREEIDHVAAAVGSVCDVLARNDGGEFVRHLARGARRENAKPFRIPEAAAIRSAGAERPAEEPPRRHDRRRAVFLAHLVSSADIALFDPDATQPLRTRTRASPGSNAGSDPGQEDGVEFRR